MAASDNQTCFRIGGLAMLLKGKSAVITGCARGIGKRTVEVFARNGANIWACCRKPAAEFEGYIYQLQQACGVRITPVYFDLADSVQLKAGMKTILNSKANVDILVNNAGITHNALFQMTTIGQMKTIFEINFFAQMEITQYILRLMTRQKSGNIINISSSAALDGDSGRSAYGASKAAMICVTRALARELASSNIRVNAIAPGITQTDMLQSMTEKVIADRLQTACIKRPADTREIADAILFLASDLSSYVTGQVLRVDGGF